MTWSMLHEICEHHKDDGIIEARCQSNPEEAVFVDEHGLTPLHLLLFSNQNPSMKGVKSLLDVNSHVLLQKDQHGDTPIHIALRNNKINISIIQIMIDACPNVLSLSNKEGLLPLHVCCRHCSRRSDIIEMVASAYPEACFVHIKSGYLVKSKKTGDSDLQHVNNDVSNKFSNKYHPSTDTNGTTINHHFIADANVLSHNQMHNMIDLHFHDYDYQLRDGAYPLHIALSNDANVEVINVLIKVVSSLKNDTHGKDLVLQLKNKFGQTPFDIAKDRGYDESVVISLKP